MSNSKTLTKPIDIKKIFKEKNPNLYRVLPAFFFKYLRKIAHEEEMNYVLNTHGQKNGIDFLNEILDYFNIKAKVQGLDYLPEKSGVIIAANHPLGSMDGLLLLKTVYDHYGRAKALVNDMLMNLEPLKEFFIGFNKHGATARGTIKELNQLLEAECPIIYFPSGMVSRRYNGIIQDPEWKKTFVSNAVHYNRPIVPVFISGRLSESFYRKSDVRRFLNIKTNIEMLYLPHEMFKLKQPKLDLTFGKPISPEQTDKSRHPAEWAELIRQHVYRLSENPDAKFGDINKI